VNELVQQENESALIFPEVSKPARWSKNSAGALLTPSSEPAEHARGFENLLVATDFSHGEQAVRAAGQLAERFRAHLTVLHVVDTNPSEAMHYAGNARALMSRLWHNAAQKMNALIEHLAMEGVAVEGVIAEGLPTEQIVSQSANFDLLLLGKPEARHRWNFFSVNTARRVLQEAACPVLIV
jgi:nucleotide-binding universal stress UspA family protein